MKKLLIFLIMSLFMVGIASASPSPSLLTTTWGKNSVVNISLTDGENVTYVTVFAASTSTANSTTGTIYNITNSTATDFNAKYANFTFGNDLVLEDAKDYTISFKTTGTVSAADAKTGTSSTNVLIDRTVPTVATTSHTSGTVFDAVSTSTITYTVTDANTISCRIAFLIDGATPRFTGTNTFAMTYSTTSCTYTVTKATIPDGIYDVYVQASDGTNTSTSLRINFEINTIEDDSVSSGIKDIEVPLAQEIVKSQNLTEIVIFAIIIVVLLYVFVLSKKTKK